MRTLYRTFYIAHPFRISLVLSSPEGEEFEPSREETLILFAVGTRNDHLVIKRTGFLVVL